MKLTISNVTRNNVNAIKALVRVALNQECTVTKYEVTDLTRTGYNAAHELYWNTSTTGVNNREEASAIRLAALEQAANPFEEHTPQWFGWKRALCAAKNNELYHVSDIWRYELAAECNIPDTDLLFRFAHQLGKTYRNCVVTMN